MQPGWAAAAKLIDISRLPGLAGIDELDDGATRIGALVRNADLAGDPAFAGRYPMVAEALLSGASGQLRNAATVAGNLMQYPRDAYFPGPEPDPMADASSLSVLGAGGEPVTVHPSDFCVPLVALDAVVEILGPDGPREIALADLYQPGEPRTTLIPGELVTALRLPAAAAEFRANCRYLKVRDRTSFAFAMASAAASLRMDGPHIAEARLSLGAVAPKPWRVAEAEALLKGQAPGADLFARAADAAMAGAQPVGGNGWKIELARRTAARALAMAAAGTPADMPALPASPFGNQTGDLAHV